jgi:5-methyltetrahydropteroyltriglutamate--homocysteine methyltransferase
VTIRWSAPSLRSFNRPLSEAVERAVRYQRDCGIDIVCDGELGRLAWHAYLTERLSGFTLGESTDAGDLFASKDWTEFTDYYREDFGKSYMVRRWATPATRAIPVCTGPIAYTGQAAIAEEISI